MVDIWIKKEPPGPWPVARICPRFADSRHLPGSSSKIGWARRRPFSYGGRYGPCGVGNLRTRSASIQFSAICGRHEWGYRENLWKSWAIMGNLGKSEKSRPAPRIGSSGSWAIRYDTPRSTRRFDAPPIQPSHGCGRFFPSKSMHMNDMPLNLHLPYSVTTYPSRSRSGVIAITLYGVPLTSSPFASSFSTP